MAPPEQAPAPTFAFPPRPEQTITSSWRGPTESTTTKVETPEMLAAADDARAAQEEEERKRREAFETQQKVDEIARIQEENKARVAQYNDLERQRLEAAEQQRIKEEVGKLEADEQRARQGMTANAKITDYWEDRSAPAKVISALLVGMGGYAASRGGGQNTALEIFNRAEANDRAAKEAKYAKSKEWYDLTRDNTAQGRARAEQVLKDRRVQWDREAEARTRVMLAEGEAVVRRTKNPLAQAEFAKLEAAKAAELAEKAQKRQDDFAVTVTQGKAESSGSTTTNVDGPNAKPPVDTYVRGEGGKVIAVAPNEVEKKLAQTAVDAHREFSMTMSLLRDNFNKYGSFQVRNREAVAERENLVANAQLQLKEIKKLGTLDKGSEAFLNRLIPQGGLLATDKGVMRSLDTAQKMADNQRQIALDRIGGAPKPAPAPARGTDPGGDIDLAPEEKKKAAPPPASVPRGERAADLAKLQKEIARLPKGSPERARAERLKATIIEGRE